MFTFAPAPKSKRPLGYLFALSATAIVLAFGSTLAANININTGPIEFGQGVALTTSCSGTSAITLTPHSTFENADAGGAFMFSSLTLSNIPTSCSNNIFTIKAFSNSSSQPLALFNTDSSEVKILNSGEFSSKNAGLTLTTPCSSTLGVVFTVPTALAKDVYSLTIESAPLAETVLGNCPGSLHFISPGSSLAFDDPYPGPGTGAYTVEGWYNFDSAPDGTNELIFSNVNGLSMYINPAMNTFALNDWGGSWKDSYPLTLSSAITINTWHHIALSRNSDGVTAVWVDGVRSANTITDNQSYAHFPNIFPGTGAGSDYLGYLTNIRSLDRSIYDPTKTLPIAVPAAQLLADIGTMQLLRTNPGNPLADGSAFSLVVNTKGGISSTNSPFTSP
jgi:Concanavalin A-like lectin/glucanases superfamily